MTFGDTAPDPVAMDGYVPVLDITNARSGSPHARQQTATKIDAVCRESGFLVITGHGIDQALIQRMHDTTLTMFEQSDE